MPLENMCILKALGCVSVCIERNPTNCNSDNLLREKSAKWQFGGLENVLPISWKSAEW